jgi:hypothetical protein
MITNQAKGTQHPTKVYTKDYNLEGGYKAKVWIGKWPNDGPFIRSDYEPVIYITDPKGKTHAVARAHWGLATYANIKSQKGEPENFSPYIPNSWHTPYFDAEHVELPKGSIQKATWFLAKLDHITTSPTRLYKGLVSKKGVINDLPHDVDGLEVNQFSETVVNQGINIWKKTQRDRDCAIIRRGKKKLETQKNAVSLAMGYAKKGLPMEKAVEKIQRKFGFSFALASKLANDGYTNGVEVIQHLEDREESINQIETRFEQQRKSLGSLINSVLDKKKEEINEMKKVLKKQGKGGLIEFLRLRKPKTRAELNADLAEQVEKKAEKMQENDEESLKSLREQVDKQVESDIEKDNEMIDDLKKRAKKRAEKRMKKELEEES